MRHTAPSVDLFLLGTATASLLRGLDALLVCFDLALALALHHAGEPSVGLPRSLQVAAGGVAENVHLDEVLLEGALERDDGLDEQRVGVVEVQVHDAHHADAHELGLEQAAQLLLVVGVDRGGHGFGLLGAAHGRWLDVLEDRHV